MTLEAGTLPALPKIGTVAASLRRTRRVLESPQGARVREGGRTLTSFASNDYLGLANHPRLRAAAIAAIELYGTGAGASPLVTGHLRIHEESEQAFARFVHLPRALLFGSGYAANLGILATLADRHAEIFADKLNHACLNDGAILSRARLTRYPHGDLATLAARVSASSASTKIVATDAVFSMDGDLAPLGALVDLCEAHDAWLVVDDAHGIGVLGAHGRGSLDDWNLAGSFLDHGRVRSPRIVYMATLGKALGGYGAFVCAEASVIDWLVQRARTYIYSTALPPMAPAVAKAAIELLQEDDSLVATLRDRIAAFKAACKTEGIVLEPSSTAIQPLIVEDVERTLAVSARLRDDGFLVPAIRPPTVPDGTSRLRISISAAHETTDVEQLAGALARALA